HIDIIHCNTYSPVLAGWILSKLTGIPLIITIHDVAALYGLRFWKKWMEQFGSFSSVKALIGYLLELLIVRISKNVHTVSDTSKRDILRINPRCEIVVVPNGLDLEQYNVKHDNITYDDFILFIGRHVYYKNLDVVIEGFKLLKGRCNAKLVVLGDGPMKSQWQKLVKKYDLNDVIEFKGRVSHIEKIHLLSKARALVLPSIFEGFGIVVLEAWALRKPVIVADVEPLNKLVQHNVDGFLARPDDSHEWAEFIFRLSNDESLARKLGESGTRKLLKNYTIRTILEEFERVYLETIRKRARKR
ncbi:MAG: glycosyltransferase family 4 protein, partial [Candidatus Njordarchaeales archaeon]